MAVYTEVSDEDLTRFLARYDVGELMSFKGIAEGVENTNYFVHTSKGQFILTLYEKRVNVADLPYFLGLTTHLAGLGVPCPLPVPATSGETLGELNGRRAALITFLEGVSVKRPTPAHCEMAGEALATLHLAGQSFKGHRANALGPSGWPPLFRRFESRADEIMPGLRSLIESELAFQAGGLPPGLPQGVIHADLFPDNVLFAQGRLSGLIDFYFACNDALAYDLGICLNAWCFDQHHAFVPERGHALFAGYERKRPLAPSERAAMPALARAASLRFLLTRAYDWLNRPAGAIVTPHDPRDYVARLAFNRAAKSIRDFGGA